MVIAYIFSRNLSKWCDSDLKYNCKNECQGWNKVKWQRNVNVRVCKNYAESLWSVGQAIWCFLFLQILSLTASLFHSLSHFIVSPTPPPMLLVCNVLPSCFSIRTRSLYLSLSHRRSPFSVPSFMNRGVQHVACCSLAFDPGQFAQR